MRVVELPAEHRTMSRVLREQAAAIGSRPFLLCGDQRFSFAQADAVVDDYARGLRALGAGRGTHVAAMMENGPEFLWLWLALKRIGAVCVPVNTAYKSGYLRHVLGHAQAEVVVVDAALADRVASVAGDLPALRSVVVHGAPPDVPFAGAGVLSLADVPRPGPDAPDADVDPADIATILYTSGTTGASKGAMQSHNYWYDATVSSNDRRDIRSDDVFYVASPMFHAAAWVVCLYSGLTTGLPVALDRRFSVSEFWNRLRHYGATQIFTMSAMHMWLLKAPPTPADLDNPARVWGPVPLAPELHEPFKARFGIEHLWFTYGQTEALMITTTDTARPYKPGSAGWARKEVELAVVDERDRILAPDSVGELVVRPRTPHTIMEGYWDQPQATVDAFRNLWYHTGDVAKIDADGEVFFLDRKKDYLRVRGENVSSFEVEATIADHPDVAEAAAFAVPSGEGEDEVMICIIRSADSMLSAEDLAAYCNDNLPHFAVPRFIDFVDELPRTPTNRVQKYQLRERGVTDTTWDRVAAGFQLTR